jgi:hypothetical protein
VVSSIDLTTGRETELHRFLCDITPGGETRGSSTEHHGGNLFAARDGSVFLGIGDYGIGFLAPDPAWNAGKMWRVLPDGSAKLFAKGFRNPFDLAWDEVTQRVIITDNGDVADDEIDVIAEGDDAGWPFTAGRRAAPEGTAAPVYSFASVVAPTGLAQLGGRNPILRSGYLLGAYVTKAIYYIPDIYARPLPDPIAVVKGESDPVIDVIETQDGSVYFATMTAIYQLIVPLRGDCNGDGLIDALDVSALAREIAEGPHAMVAAQGGANRGSWGCDVNGDGVIDTRDAVALGKAVRTRATRVR